MKKLALLVVTLVTVGFGLSLLSQRVSANGADFSVKAILPETQKSTDVSYFDFELFPGEEKTIEIEIGNSTSQDQTYLVEVNTATTNMNGVIEYTKGERDNTLPLSLSDSALVEPQVTVPAGSTMRVPIELKMPDRSFEGILLGGIRVAEVVDDKEETQQIANRFSYSIAIVLSQGNDMPDPDLTLTDVYVEQVNRRNVISANIQNKASTIVNELNVDAQIFRQGQDKPLFHRNGTGLRMAPNSNFNFGVETNNKPLRAGKYTMKVKAVSGEQEWEWKQDFEITADEANELNETAVELETDNTMKYLLIAGGVVALLLLIVIGLLIKNRQKKEMNSK